jgi:small subunit ribosomal protein S8
MMTDPIADMLTRIRNACKAQLKHVDVPYSEMKLNITRILKSEGIIEDFKVAGDIPRKIIRLFLKYTDEREPVIRGIKRVSRPGLRRYVKADKVPRPAGGLGIAIMSTPKGIMTAAQSRKEGIGGEVLCYVW